MGAAIDFDLLRDTGARLAETREGAREEAVRAIRLLERRFVEALGGGPVRGLTNLAPGARGQLRAASVRSRRHGIDAFLDPRGEDQLVILADGHLAVAWLEDGLPRSVRAADEDLRAEDLEPYVRAVQAVLSRHVDRAEATALGYARARALAERIAGVVGHAF